MRDNPKNRHGRTHAQWYCLIAGGLLLVIGLLGFLVNAGFETGDAIDGDSLLGFEVNGWHNLVHIASGLTLLAAANTRPTAKAIALAFGLTYALVALIGIVDGSDVFGAIPVNGPDNLLHIALAGLGIAAALNSAATRRGQDRNERTRRGRFDGATPRDGEIVPDDADQPAVNGGQRDPARR